MDCIFCKIVAGEIPSKKVYEDEELLAFHDVDPKAPVHILIIPKVHIVSAYEIGPGNAQIVSKIFLIAAQLAKEFDLGENGYRMVTNIGEAGGQSVPHLHFHLLGGRDFAWPPG